MMENVTNLTIHSSHLEIARNVVLEGKYIDFVSLKSVDNNNYNEDFLVLKIASINRIFGMNIDGALEFKNFDIRDCTIINEEMVLEMFVDSDINITNYIDNYDYNGLYVCSDSEDLSVSLNSSCSDNSISNIVLHKIKMNSGLENNDRVYCYFNAAIHMFIHDNNIRDAIKSYDDNYNELPSNELINNEFIFYQLMYYFKQLIIITEYKNCNINVQSDLLTKIRDLVIFKVTRRFDNINNIRKQEDSNEVYNIIFTFLKNNSSLINDNLLVNALNLYGSTVCIIKSVVCEILDCKGLNNNYLKYDNSNNIYDEIRLEQPKESILKQCSDNKLSLLDGLKYYQNFIEDIESDNIIYMKPCSDCQQNSCFFKFQKRIVKYPQILTISLQRFAFDIQATFIAPFMLFPLQVSLKELQLLDKHTLINFDNNFDNYLDQFDNDSVYYLSKFVQHRGNSLESGHYHAYVLDRICNLWYCYNDNTVTLMTPEEIEIEIANTIDKGIQYAFYEKDIIDRNLTFEGSYNLLLLSLILFYCNVIFIFVLLDTERIYLKFKNYVGVDNKEIYDEIEFSDNCNSSDNNCLSSNDDNDGDDDGTINKKKTITNKNVPPKALSNGLYCGPIPQELKDLNFVEITMISINNPITKIRVEG